MKTLKNELRSLTCKLLAHFYAALARAADRRGDAKGAKEAMDVADGFAELGYNG